MRKLQLEGGGKGKLLGGKSVSCRETQKVCASGVMEVAKAVYAQIQSD